TVSSLAKNQRVIVYRESIGDVSLRARLDGLSRSFDAKISVFDFSNAWENGYLGIQNSVKLVDDLGSLLMPESLLVFTYMAQRNSNPASGTTFKYSVTSLQDSGAAQDLAYHLGNLSRQDPSLNPPRRSRVERYDLF
ncbi:MAG: hypothetical protein RBT63_07440, partial [Bdellovibrionales bacterium]|nr:hypothetical protein [Bdellovibrionales bacterium]